MSTYLPFEGYRNYSMSNRSALHLWVVCWFSVQPLTFSLFILNQPKTVTPPTIQILPSYHVPKISLFWCPWRKPSITIYRWAALGTAWRVQELNDAGSKKTHKYCTAPAFLKCSLIPDCSIRAHIHKARHPEIDGNLSVDYTICVLSLQVLEVNPRCYKELLKLHLNWK